MLVVYSCNNIQFGNCSPPTLLKGEKKKTENEHFGFHFHLKFVAVTAADSRLHLSLPFDTGVREARGTD